MLTAATILCTVGAFASLGVFIFWPERRLAGVGFPAFVVLIALAILLGYGEVG